MRYSIRRIYGENNIEITATEEHNEKDFFSENIVDGIVLYCEQWKPEFEDFAGVSFLLKDDILTKKNISLVNTRLLKISENKYQVLIASIA